MNYPIERLETRALLAHIGLDADFGDDGVAPFGASLFISELPDGDIIAVNNSAPAEIAKVRRLNADGSPDAAFNDPGAPLSVEQAGAAAVISSNRLIIAGQSAGANPRLFYARALELDTGAPDNSFSGDGIITFVPQSPKSAATVASFLINSMIAAPDGGLLLGITQNLSDSDHADVIYKLNSAGQLDSSFDGDGIKVLHVGSETFPQLAAVPNGRFVVLEDDGTTHSLRRYNSNGSLDTTFGDQGVAQAPVIAGAMFPSFIDLIAQPDGKLLIPVNDHQDLVSHGYVTRLTADGDPDSTFGSGGVVSLGNITSGRFALDSSGRLLGVDFETFFRLDTDGSPDTTFDDDGFLTVADSFTYLAATNASGGVIAATNERMSRFVPGPAVDIDSSGVVRIDGTGDADTISASLAGDTLIATLNGQDFTFAAADATALVIEGREGDDQIDVAVDLSVTAYGGGGNDSITTAGGRDLVYGDSTNLFAISGHDTVHAGAGDDLVFGGMGNDFLSGDAGADRIFGELGNDSISGGDGNDKLYGGHAHGSIPGNETFFDGSDSLSGNAGNDHCDGMVGNDRVAGNGGRDRLFGGDDDDRIYGGASGDWLYGASGADQLFGEGGLDRLFADDEEGPNGVDTLHGNAGNDILISRDTFHDLLFGDGGHDSADSDDIDELTSIESSQ